MQELRRPDPAADPSHDLEPTDVLVAGAKAGDRIAFGCLYERYATRVLGYLRGLGVPDPEDTLGEVFVSVVRDIGTFEGDEVGFRSWLFTIAHRRAVDDRRVRSRRHEESRDPSGLRDLGASIEDLADGVVDRIGLGARALDAIELLTEDQRAVVLLRIIGDLSVADTAAVLGKQPGAVKTLQRRALAALRRSLMPMVVT